MPDDDDKINFPKLIAGALARRMKEEEEKQEMQKSVWALSTAVIALLRERGSKEIVVLRKDVDALSEALGDSVCISVEHNEERLCVKLVDSNEAATIKKDLLSDAEIAELLRKQGHMQVGHA